MTTQVPTAYHLRVDPNTESKVLPSFPSPQSGLPTAAPRAKVGVPITRFT